MLRRYLAAIDDADISAVAELLAADVRATMPPYEAWFADRDGVLAALSTSWDPGSPYYVGRLRAEALVANGGPAVALYAQPPGRSAYEAFAISVLRIEGGSITAMTAFHDPRLFAAFGLPTHR